MLLAYTSQSEDASHQINQRRVGIVHPEERLRSAQLFIERTGCQRLHQNMKLQRTLFSKGSERAIRMHDGASEAVLTLQLRLFNRQHVTTTITTKRNEKIKKTEPLPD